MGIKDLVRINEVNQIDNEPIWYDLKDKVYRKQFHCVVCGKRSGCLCYRDYDTAVYTDDSLMCSIRCSLKDLYECCIEEIIDIVQNEIHIPIHWCTNEEIEELIQEVEDIEEYYGECPDDEDLKMSELSQVKTRPMSIDEMSDEEVDEMWEIVSDSDNWDDIAGEICN